MKIKHKKQTSQRNTSPVREGGVRPPKAGWSQGETSPSKKKQKAETFRAVVGHTEMALSMLGDSGLSEDAKGTLLNDEGLRRDIVEYMKGYDSGAFANYVSENYESGADYWKLMKDGSLAFDGKATLTDEEGNVIKSWKQMGVSSDSAVEGALINILGIDPNDKKAVEVVRKVMAETLSHSITDSEINRIMLQTISSENFSAEDAYNNTDSDKWKWTGIGKTSVYNVSDVDITSMNMGKEIGLDSINKIYTQVNADSDIVSCKKKW